MMSKSHGKNERIEDKKRVLWQQLEQAGCLWSYAKNANNINDNLLIEKALLYLEFEDLHKLCELYQKSLSLSGITLRKGKSR